MSNESGCVAVVDDDPIMGESSSGRWSLRAGAPSGGIRAREP